MGGVSVEANNESVAALAGIQAQDILMSEWRNSTYRQGRLLLLVLLILLVPLLLGLLPDWACLPLLAASVEVCCD